MELLAFLEGVRTPVLDAVMSAVTHLGSETFFMAAAIFVFWCVDKYCGYYMLGTGLIGAVLNQFLKLAFRIDRPWVRDPSHSIVESARAEAAGYSFPSGHTQNVMAALGAPAVRTRRPLIRWLCAAFVLLTSFSRLYLGVHTLADVLTSLGIGLLLIWLLYPVFIRAQERPARASVVLAVGAALALGYVLWAELWPFPADVDAENLASGVKNGYTALGTLAGMLLVFNLDRKYIKFRTGAFPWAQALKLIVGLGLTVALRAGLKQPLLDLLGGHNAAHALRYFIIVMFVGAVWPLTFPWFAARCPIGKKGRRALLILIIILAVLILLAGALYWAVTRNTAAPPVEYTADSELITPLGTTMLSAHRAGGGEAPENTLMSFQACVESDVFNVDIFEMDLHLTADGELILLHDGTLDRTSNAAEYFGMTDVVPADYTYAQLRQLNMGESFEAADGSFPYRGLRGEDIPDTLRIISLRDLLSYLEPLGEFRYIIEIKDGGDPGRLAADKLYATLCEYGCLERAVIGTFHNEITEYLDTAYPDMPRSAGVREVLKFYACELLGLRVPADEWSFDALQIPVDKYVVNLGTTRLVNYAHKYGVAVQYWTINEPGQMAYLQSIGADAIMTDVPEAAAAVLVQP